jgi:hypothetical protein
MAKYNGQTVTVSKILGGDGDNSFVNIAFEDATTAVVALGAVGELTQDEKNDLGHVEGAGDPQAASADQSAVKRKEIDPKSQKLADAKPNT